MSVVSGYVARFFGYYGLVTVSLYAMSSLVPKAGFVARSLTAYVCVGIASCVGVLSAVVFSVTGGRRQDAQWAAGRTFHHLMRLTTGTSFVVDDPSRALDRPAVFVGNHQTQLDILMLGALSPRGCSVTAKASLRWVPLLGWFMALSGAVFIDRANASDARSAMDGAAKEIAAGDRSVYIFPEGTRSYSREPALLPFKKGAFHLAVQAGVPIVPCVVANYSHVFHIKDMRFNAGCIPVKVLDPIPTTGLTVADVPDLVQRTHDLMLKEIILLTASTRNQPIPVPAATAEILKAQEKPVSEVQASLQVSP